MNSRGPSSDRDRWDLMFIQFLIDNKERLFGRNKKKKQIKLIIIINQVSLKTWFV